MEGGLTEVKRKVDGARTEIGRSSDGLDGKWTEWTESGQNFDREWTHGEWVDWTKNGRELHGGL